MKRVTLSILLSLLMLNIAALAHGTTHAGARIYLAPQAQAAEPPAKLILKEGTDVKLKFAQPLSSKTATDDDPVNLVLDEDLKVGDVTVAKAGCKGCRLGHERKKGWHD